MLQEQSPITTRPATKQAKSTKSHKRSIKPQSRRQLRFFKRSHCYLPHRDQTQITTRNSRSLATVGRAGLPASRARPSPAAPLGARAARPAEGTCCCQHRFLLPANRAAPLPPPARGGATSASLRASPASAVGPGGLGPFPEPPAVIAASPPAAVGSFNAASYDGVSLRSEQPHLQERSLPYPIPLSLHHHSPSPIPPQSPALCPPRASPQGSEFCPQGPWAEGKVVDSP